MNENNEKQILTTEEKEAFVNFFRGAYYANAFEDEYDKSALRKMAAQNGIELPC